VPDNRRPAVAGAVVGDKVTERMTTSVDPGLAPLASEDTIVALATVPGRSALALIRLSGPGALEIASRVLRPWPLEPGRARRCAAVDADGTILDRPVVTVHVGPRSYTGEDTVEVSTHGGLIAPASVMAALVAAGARPATPGEFTRRAVLNGKLDLAQAEAVGDLIDARSAAMRRVALSHIDGGLSRRIRALRETVLRLEALIAYDIDFPGEDDGPVSRERVATAAMAAADDVAGLLATAPAGELIRAGAVVVIAGAPNVGKSSLFNALLGRARALVSDVPGTTRDALDALIEPAGSSFPIRLVDTAGLRDTTDVVERLGIEVSEGALADAHAVLACGETLSDMMATVHRVRRHTAAPTIGVWTKLDTGPSGPLSRESIARCLAAVVDDATPADMAIIGVSAHTGAGLRPLLEAIQGAVEARWGVPAPDMPVVTRARHRAALEHAAAELEQFREAWAAAELPAVVAAVHLRAAVASLEEIIGTVSIEDVLARVFAEFCVGK
jgi:tRNA modification GTPase